MTSNLKAVIFSIGLLIANALLVHYLAPASMLSTPIIIGIITFSVSAQSPERDPALLKITGPLRETLRKLKIWFNRGRLNLRDMVNQG